MTASGKFHTSGSWSLSDAGVLTLSGTVDDTYFGKSSLYDYRDKIKSVVCASGTVIASFDYLFHLSGDKFFDSAGISATSIDLSNAKISATDWSNAFVDCKSLSALKLSSASGVTDLSSAFLGCTSLASLDLSMVSTATGCDCNWMFSLCNSLSRVVFGSGFNVNPTTKYGNDVDTDFGSAKNLATGLSIASRYDSGGKDPFAMLTAAERKGTWDRTVKFAYSAKAERDPSKPTVTISVTFATNSKSSTRAITVYRKNASDASYPLTAFGTIACSGDSGTFSSTFSCDDQAYDFKVVFDDGEGKYVAYPAVDANVLLMELTKDGTLNLPGDATFTRNLVEVGRTLLYDAGNDEGVWYEVHGGYVWVQCSYVKGLNSNGWKVPSLIPEAYCPKYACWYPGAIKYSNNVGAMWVGETGEVWLYDYGNTGEKMCATAMYPIKQ